MTDSVRQQVELRLGSLYDINQQRDLVSAGNLRDVRVEAGRLMVDLEFGYPLAGEREAMTARVHEALRGMADVTDISVTLHTRIVSHAVQKGVKPLAGVKNTIAVASGKGGVGKSTTAVNLALALQAEGAKVGILDADIYGPSQPRMLGCFKKPDTADGKKLRPNISYGLQSMSIGYLIDEETPMIWRGPMVTSALEQMIGDTLWEDLDYLIIDLPPGTGDIQLTLCQKIPVSGAVIVTTPQDIALLDARRALKMFQKVEVSVLGIVENMSTHICSQCGHEEHIFGAGGGAAMAEQYGVQLLGSLPLDIGIREGVDQGKPTVVITPDSPITGDYRRIARRASGLLAQQSRDYSGRFPKIVIENT